jgi:3-oxoadipate enol-lactonase
LVNHRDSQTDAVELMVEVDAGTIWVEDRGDDGMPVLLLHPGWGDSTIWDPMIELIPPATRIIRCDARGYGRSPSSRGPFTQVADVTAVLDRLDVPRTIVMGHSGGGATAVSLALSQPDRVHSLLLVAPGVDGYPWPPGDPYLTELIALYRANDGEGLVALGLRTWATADPGPAAEAQIRRAVAAMFRQGDHERPGPPTFDRLHELRVPTQLSIGDQDRPMIIDCATAIAARISGCRLTSLPGVDHLVPLRAPELLARMIEAERHR